MKICPHLGLLHDAPTPVLFPSERNFCHCAQPALAVRAPHQQACCLGQAHETCPVFLDPNAAAKADFLYRPGSARPALGLPALLGSFALVLVLGLAIWYYRAGLPPAARPDAGQPAPLAPAAAAQETPTLLQPSATARVEPSASPRATSTLISATETETAPVSAPPGLGTPIGVAPALVIHRVAGGESLTALADRYGTTVDAIRAVNLMLPLPLWENWLIVIPFETSEVAGLPLFEVYQVNTQGLTVTALAKQLLVDGPLLARYNGLDEESVFASGQWVLVPHSAP